MRRIYITYAKDGELYTKEATGPSVEYNDINDIIRDFFERKRIKYKRKKIEDGDNTIETLCAEGIVSMCIIEEKEGGNQ